MNMDMKGMLTKEELDLGAGCLRFSLAHGASKARVSLSKCVQSQLDTLNGELDKLTHSLDRSMAVNLFVDGRFGSFMINRFEPSELEDFILKAIDSVRMLAPDPCRDLPDPSRTEKGAVTGFELDLCDPAYDSVTPEQRISSALAASVWHKYPHPSDDPLAPTASAQPSGNLAPTASAQPSGNLVPTTSAQPSGSSSASGAPTTSDGDFLLISEEGSWEDSLSDNCVIDSNGLYCRHIETNFSYCSQVSIADASGNIFTGNWWNASSRFKDFDIRACGDTAIKRAVSSMSPQSITSTKTNLIVETGASSRLLMPLMDSLNAFSIQQNNSFLAGTLGKRVFPLGLTVLDDCRTPGQSGSVLFDSEGVATKAVPIISQGVVCEYFVSTYMSLKMNIPATVDDCTRLRVKPWNSVGAGNVDSMMAQCGEGILVTAFNGGNCNSATGNFSYGVEGFAFKDGKLTHPVRGVVITGSYLTLWNNLLSVGNDARPCSTQSIPTLAFREVDFSA